MRTVMGKMRGLGLAACLAAAGCGRGGGGGNAVAARPLDLKRDANDLVAEAVSRQAALNTLNGEGTLTLVDPASKLNQRVKAEVFAADGQRLRVSGGKMGVHGFDLLMYNDNVMFHDALDKKVYTGTVADLQYIQLPMRPEEILNQLLKPSTELSYVDWRPDPSRRNDPSGAAAFVASDGRTEYRALLDKRTGLLVRVEYARPGGRVPYMARTFGNYRLVDASRARGGAPSPVAPPVFAYMQRIEWPAERRKVEFAFNRVVADAPLAQSDFNVKLSDRVQRLPLNQAGMAPSGFQELSMR